MAIRHFIRIRKTGRLFRLQRLSEENLWILIRKTTECLCKTQEIKSSLRRRNTYRRDPDIKEKSINGVKKTINIGKQYKIKGNE